MEIICLKTQRAEQTAKNKQAASERGCPSGSATKAKVKETVRNVNRCEKNTTFTEHVRNTNAWGNKLFHPQNVDDSFVEHTRLMPKQVMFDFIFRKMQQAIEMDDPVVFLRAGCALHRATRFCEREIFLIKMDPRDMQDTIRMVKKDSKWCGCNDKFWSVVLLYLVNLKSLIFTIILDAVILCDILDSKCVSYIRNEGNFHSEMSREYAPLFLKNMWLVENEADASFYSQIGPYVPGSITNRLLNVFKKRAHPMWWFTGGMNLSSTFKSLFQDVAEQNYELYIYNIYLNCNQKLKNECIGMPKLEDVETGKLGVDVTQINMVDLFQISYGYNVTNDDDFDSTKQTTSRAQIERLRLVDPVAANIAIERLRSDTRQQLEKQKKELYLKRKRDDEIRQATRDRLTHIENLSKAIVAKILYDIVEAAHENDAAIEAAFTKRINTLRKLNRDAYNRRLASISAREMLAVGNKQAKSKSFSYKETPSVENTNSIVDSKKNYADPPQEQSSITEAPKAKRKKRRKRIPRPVEEPVALPVALPLALPLAEPVAEPIVEEDIQFHLDLETAIQASLANSANLTNESARFECAICMDATPTYIGENCFHMCVCEQCALLLDTCPICTTKTSFKKVFM